MSREIRLTRPQGASFLKGVRKHGTLRVTVGITGPQGKSYASVKLTPAAAQAVYGTLLAHLRALTASPEPGGEE